MPKSFDEAVEKSALEYNKRKKRKAEGDSDEVREIGERPYTPQKPKSLDDEDLRK